MMIYWMTFLLGILSAAACVPYVKREQKMRKEQAKRAIHMCLCRGRDMSGRQDLTCTEYILGRRSRFSDLNLSTFNDLTISRTHARMWLEDGSYWLQPFPSRENPTKPAKTSVNNYPLQLGEAVPLKHGDMICIGKQRFYMIDTEKMGGNKR